MTKNYDALNNFTKEERVRYYVAMYEFWKSVCDKNPTARNLSMAGRFKKYKEQEE